MSDNTQRAIIAQTSAKIASELMVHLNPKGKDDLLDKFHDIFRSVFHEINTVVHTDEKPEGRRIPVLKQEDMQMKLSEYTAMAGSATTSDTITSEDIGLSPANPIPVKKMKRNWSDDGEEGTLKIKGSNEPAPAWLIRAAAKDGVTEVFDNRPNKIDNPKRPDYVSTGVDKKAYWAPKER
jgi:hypothetical protein